MARVLQILVIGIVVGVAIVAGIAAIGMKQAEQEQQAAAVERKWADRRVGKNLPPTLEFWRDGYQTGAKLDRWSETNRRTLSAYLRDWQLFPAMPSVEGPPQIDEEAIEYIHRRHAATQAQYRDTGTPDCKVWIERPQARETLTWNGECLDGFATGEGVLFRKFIRNGQVAEAGFSGTMKEGRSDGEGITWLPSGHTYEGGHRAGKFRGFGKLTMPWGDESFSGSFTDGYPHGLGELVTPQKTYTGSWSKGCYFDGEAWAVALRHRYECFGGDHFEGALDSLADFLD